MARGHTGPLRVSQGHRGRRTEKRNGLRRRYHWGRMRHFTVKRARTQAHDAEKSQRAESSDQIVPPPKWSQWEVAAPKYMDYIKSWFNNAGATRLSLPVARVQTRYSAQIKGPEYCLARDYELSGNAGSVCHNEPYDRWQSGGTGSNMPPLVYEVC